ncbi:MAG: transglutaminase-like domain-containing protein [Pirellulaceae bacterium]|nr:transglutaminase-like domain-containing protein [Pirellulaceae bacterium]
MTDNMRISGLTAQVLAALLLIVQWSAADAEGPSAGTLPADGQRLWTDSTGRFRVEAKLVEHRDDAVVLETSPGNRVTVPVERLSTEDQRYLRERAADGPEVGRESVVLRYANPVVSQVRIGLEMTAKDGACNNLVATFPLPMAWPEQIVELVSEDVSPTVQRVTKRTLNDGVQQVEFRVPRLVAGQSAHVIYTLRVERLQIMPPENPQLLRFAGNPGRELRPYLGESPFIEINHAKVKAASNEIEIDPSLPAWRQVETIYDWTRARVDHHDGTKPLKGALQALETGSGDCEEITSLFVAMCRLKGIPARSVWVDHHTYPEFYLESPNGEGLWIPCESLGARLFGGMNSYRLLLQKGDNFSMSQKRGPQRYVTPTISGTVGPDGGQPVMREVLEQEKIQ